MDTNKTNSSTTYSSWYSSPIGTIEITGTLDVITSVLFIESEPSLFSIPEDTPQVIRDCWHELDDYFKGNRVEFTVPYRQKGTDFQSRVWQALTTIPYSETASYQDIARSIDNEKAVRAVGTTNGKNKLCILVPCHRIIGANGTLTGYAGGIWRKKWLLEHEQNHKQK